MRLRKATTQDVDSVVSLILAMLQDMASYGSHTLNEEGQVSSRLRARFTDVSEEENHVFLLAVQEGAEEEIVGVVEASTVSAYDVFRPKLVLHIHSIYVRPNHREQGLGRMLLEAALGWGKGKACQEAELNVLVSNPARRLYESLGFEVFELEMRLEL
jgi:ribosomal protein S18 acetylase RimI-like enzyme